MPTGVLAFIKSRLHECIHDGLHRITWSAVFLLLISIIGVRSTSETSYDQHLSQASVKFSDPRKHTKLEGVDGASSRRVSRSFEAEGFW